MANTILITDAGLAEVVEAEQGGFAPVVITEVGYGTGQYTPTGDMTALKEEFKRLTTIAGGAVGDNVIHLARPTRSTRSASTRRAEPFSRFALRQFRSSRRLRSRRLCSRLTLL